MKKEGQIHSFPCTLPSIAKHGLPLLGVSVPRAKRAVNRLSLLRLPFMAGLITVVAMVSLGAAEPAPEMKYARGVERELAGEVAAAVADYRAILSALPVANLALTGKLLYRIGVCEKRLGHSEQARQAWRKVVDTCPPDDSRVEAARVALKNLERELDRVVMKGRVQGPEVRSQNPESRIQNFPSTQQLNTCFVMAGEWGSEPPALCDTNGAFKLERKVAGRLRDGRRYGYVFAEHPVNPWVGGGVWVEGGATNVFFVAGNAPEFLGRVEDGRGNAVREALIRVMGYAEVGGEEIALPFDNLLPPCFSGTNGEFRVTGLIPGCRYVFTAEKEGWRLASAVSGEGIIAPLPPILLQSLGDISLRGRVVDESGKGVQARVAAWSDTPNEHELARVEADENGQFLFRDLRENLIALRVESEGCSPRLLPGIKPMGQEIDVVVRGRERKESVQYSVFRSQKSEGRIQNPEVRIQNSESEYRTLNTEHFLPSLDWIRGNPDNGDGIRAEELRGHVVVLHFGSAYVESSLRGLYPREPGVLAQLQKVYGEQGLVVIWVLPEEEGKGEASRLALELYPDMPVAFQESVQRSVFSIQSPESEHRALSPEHSFPTPESGNLVLGRDGVVRSYCSDQQLFKAVKAATGKSDR